MKALTALFWVSTGLLTLPLLLRFVDWYWLVFMAFLTLVEERK